MTSSIDLKALNIFINSPISHDMIHKLVVSTLQVLPCKDSKSSASTSSAAKDKPLPSLMTFITRLVRYTNMYTGTLMATLVYLNRLKSKLPKNAQGLPCTRHRILLSCLILSAKFHNDSSPKNIHWAKYTDGLFSTTDINLMERQLLYLLNWDLKISNEDMIEQLTKFLEPIKQDLIKSNKMRKFIQKQKQQKELQQQLQVPSPTRSPVLSRTSLPISSASSISSRSPIDTISRSSSNSSLSINHYRQSSISSVSSMSSLESISPVNKVTPTATYLSDKVDPIIELTALNEEIELNKMLKHLQPNNTTLTNIQPCYNYCY